MITEQELYTLLSEGMELPVAYDHFKQLDGITISLPFILFRVDETTTFKADDKSLFKQNNYMIDLVTEIKDTTNEEKLEDLLNDNNLPYDKFEDYIENENIYQIRYFI